MHLCNLAALSCSNLAALSCSNLAAPSCSNLAALSCSNLAALICSNLAALCVQRVCRPVCRLIVFDGWGMDLKTQIKKNKKKTVQRKVMCHPYV